MDWQFQTSDALTAQTYAKKWWMEAKKEAYFYGHGFVGRNQNNSIIVEFPDLEKDQGYRHTYGQVRNLSGGGISGDNTMEGNEEAPNVYDDNITLSKKRNAIRTAGTLSDQYPSQNEAAVRADMRELLSRWMGGEVDQDIFTALGSSPTKVIYGGDATTTATIEDGDYFTLALIEKAVAYAKKATPKIVGPRIGGKKMNGVVVISNDQSADLTIYDSAWNQAQMDAQLRGKDNPIFTDALGMKKNVPIHEHERVAIATTWGSGSATNGATALFMGVQSGAIAYAKKRIWNEKTFDYGDKVGFCIGKIYGVSKTVFNSADNAVVAIRTGRSNN